MKHIALYHYPCPDGISAALAAHLAFKQNNHAGTFLLLIPHSTYKDIHVKDLNLKARLKCHICQNPVWVLNNARLLLQEKSSADSASSSFHILILQSRAMKSYTS